MEKKITNVVMLPTNDVTDIIVPTQGVGKGVIHLKEYYGSAVLDMNDKYQHLYFTSDEEIKAGDWVNIKDHVCKYNKVMSVTNKYLTFINILEQPLEDCKKIIATTDKKLSTLLVGGGEGNAGMWKIYPQIPQSFVEEYVKQGGIDEVEVEYTYKGQINNEEAKMNSRHLKLTPNNEVIVHLIENNKPELYTLLGNADAQEKLGLLGFKKLGSGWFGNENDNIRIRLWKDSEVDFWLWRGHNDNQIHFRGKIHSIEDVKWVLNRCFNVA